MKRNLEQNGKRPIREQVGEWKRTHALRKVWKCVLSALACVVVFVTTYLLILPAVTMETTPDAYFTTEASGFFAMQEGRLREIDAGQMRERPLTAEAYAGETLYLKAGKAQQLYLAALEDAEWRLEGEGGAKLEAAVGEAVLYVPGDAAAGSSMRLYLRRDEAEAELELRLVDQVFVKLACEDASGAPEMLTGWSGESYSLPAALTREGWTLTAWRDEAGQSYAPGSSYILRADTTLTAEWEAAQRPEVPAEEPVPEDQALSLYARACAADSTDAFWQALGDTSYAAFVQGLSAEQAKAVEQHYQSLLNAEAMEQEVQAELGNLSVCVQGKMPAGAELQLHAVEEKVSAYIRENLQGLEEDLPFAVATDSLQVLLTDRHGQAFVPQEPLQMTIRNGAVDYSQQKYDLVVTHLMDEPLAIERRLDDAPKGVEIESVEGRAKQWFADELSAAVQADVQPQDSIAFVEEAVQVLPDGGITLQVDSFSIYQVAAVDVTAGTQIPAGATYSMQVGEERVFYQDTAEVYATWTVKDTSQAVHWYLHDPGTQVEGKVWKQKYAWVRIIAQHPATGIEVTAKYGANNRQEVFYIDVEAPEAGVYIENTIPEDGFLTAHATMDGVASYQWSKLSGTIHAEALDPQDDARVNVVVDMGGGEVYAVQGYDAAGNAIPGAAAQFTVPYYNELRNGSFETPSVSVGATRFVGNGYPGLYWKTTGVGRGAKLGEDIELCKPAAAYMPRGNRYAADGAQFAEVNAEAYGALYQDIITVPGVTLYWSVAHRGRRGEDSLLVGISNLTDVAEITTQNELMSYVNGEGAHCVQAKLTDGNTEWGYYTGSYIVPEGQYVTRFWFVASSTASGNATEGNLLDSISFGANVPWRIEYYLNGQLQQGMTESGSARLGSYISASHTADSLLQGAVFTGSTIGSTLVDGEGGVKEYNGTQIYIHRRKEDGELVNVLRLYYVSSSVITVEKTVLVREWDTLTAEEKSEVLASLADGSYDAAFSLYRAGTEAATAQISVGAEELRGALDAGRGRAVFSAVFRDADGSAYYPALDYWTAQVTLQAEEEAYDSLAGYAMQTERTSEETITVSRQDSSAKQAAFSNIYTPQTVRVRITKQVVGRRTEEAFSFRAAYWAEGEKVEVPAFALRDGESFSLRVPAGAEVLVEETRADGYTILIREGGVTKTNGDSYRFTARGNTEITVQNIAGEILPATGGWAEGLGALGLFCCGTAAAGGLYVLKKRRCSRFMK